MINLPLLVFVFIVFALIIVSYSIKDVDFVAISLICMFIAAFVTGLVLEVPLSFESWFDNFVLSIEWQAIIIILSMSIISKIAQDSNVLEYLAVKIFKISKGNQRYFFLSNLCYYYIIRSRYQ